MVFNRVCSGGINHRGHSGILKDFHLDHQIQYNQDVFAFGTILYAKDADNDCG